MSVKTVYCVKLNQHAPALHYAPYPGEIGQRILQHISQPAWEGWLNEQTKIINEHRLNPLDDDARALLESSMMRYLFGADG